MAVYPLCANCGFLHEVGEPCRGIRDRGTIERRHSGSGEATVATWQERRSPARVATFQSDFVVPALQSGYTGAICALVAAFVYTVFWRMMAGESPPLMDAVYVGMAIGLMGAAVFWFKVVANTIDSLWDVEVIEQPLPGSERAERVETVTRRVRLDVEDGNHIDFIEFDFDPDKLIEVARLLQLPEKTYSHRSLVGRGKPLSRDDYEVLTEKLLAHAYLEWKNEDAPQQGVELTGRGRSLFVRLSRKESR